MKINAIILFVTIGTFLCSCDGSPKSSIEQELDQLFSDIYDPKGAGGVVLVSRENKTIFQKAYGLADIPRKQPMTLETIMNVGSLSKTFVGYGILILEKRGKLSREDNIIKYFPEFKNHEIVKNVKISNLLAHTSGLPDLRGIADSIEYYLTADDLQNFKPLFETDSLNFDPGSRFEYSNPGYNGLALIIERVTGERWQNFIINEVFGPANMTRSKITDGSFPDMGVAHAYFQIDSSAIEFAGQIFPIYNGYVETDYGEIPTFNAAGNGGVWSTVNDLKNYAKALKSGSFLSKEAIQASAIPIIHGKGHAANRGLIWYVELSDLPFYIHHAGSQGFTSDFVYFRDKDVLYTMLNNSERQVYEIRSSVIDILTKYGVI